MPVAADIVAAYRSTLGRFTRWLGPAMWLWSLLCIATTIGILGDESGDFWRVMFVFELLGSAGVLLIAPAVTLAPCIAQERERGTWPSLILAPLPPAALWSMFLSGRVLPWLCGFAPGAVALLVSSFFLERNLDLDDAIGIVAGLWWFANAGLFALMAAAWTATRFSTTPACVAIALVISLGGELALVYGSAFVLIGLAFSGAPEIFVAMFGFALPLLGNTLPAWAFAHAARNRLTSLDEAP